MVSLRRVFFQTLVAGFESPSHAFVLEGLEGVTPMIETTIQIKHRVGLHARPAALFVQTAAKFTLPIKVQNLTTNGKFVDAKSIIMVLTLGVMTDTKWSSRRRAPMPRPRLKR
jgi:phosphotransferase system HPr (HPr) family protein